MTLLQPYESACRGDCNQGRNCDCAPRPAHRPFFLRPVPVPPGAVRLIAALTFVLACAVFYWRLA